MPTLTRFLRRILIAVALVYGTMVALAMLVEPRTRPMSEPVDQRVIRDAGRSGPSA